MSDEIEINGKEFGIEHKPIVQSCHVEWSRSYGIVWCEFMVDDEPIQRTFFITHIGKLRRWVSQQTQVDSHIRLKALRDLENIEAQYHDHCINLNDEPQIERRPDIGLWILGAATALVIGTLAWYCFSGWNL